MCNLIPKFLHMDVFFIAIVKVRADGEISDKNFLPIFLIDRENK